MLLLLTSASTLRQPGSATVAALLITLLWLFIAYATPMATQARAALEGLPYQWDARGFFLIAFAMPAYILLTGLVIDLGLWALRRAGLGWRPAVWLTAATAGALHFVLDPRWLRWVDTMPHIQADGRAFAMQEWAGSFSPTLVAAGLGAALLGWMGWNVGIALRYTDK